MIFKEGDLVRMRSDVTKEDLRRVYIVTTERWGWMLKGVMVVTDSYYDVEGRVRVNVEAATGNPYNVDMKKERFGYLLDHMVEDALEGIREELQVMKGEIDG